MVRARRTLFESQNGLSPCFLYVRYWGSHLPAFPDLGAGVNGQKLERATKQQKGRGTDGRTDTFKYHARKKSVNPLKPNDTYRGRTAPLTSKRYILYIYSTNIGTEYFKHGIYSPFFSLPSKCSLFHNSNVFGSCIIHILYTGCAKMLKKNNNSGPKRLTL
jgi:hypothetical protein